MQALRHASRRVFHASVVMQETCAASAKAYSSEAASTVAARKSKERYELAKQFVTKFKAANDGRLPGITFLRKEVGGKYEMLKEVLQELGKGQDEPDTPKQTVELKDAEEKTQEFAAAVKDGDKKKSTIKEKGSKKVSKGSKAVKSVDQAHSKTISKDMGQTIQSVMPVKDASKPVTDTLLTSDEDDDDDSDVAAPEYHDTQSIQVARHKMEEGVKAGKGKEKVLGTSPISHLKKQNDDQAIESKHADIKQLEVQDGGKRIELPLKGRDGGNFMLKSLDDIAAKPLPMGVSATDGSFSYGNKPYGYAPLTTVVRIINLPGHVTASKVQALCESVAKVHEVNMRRGRIADVQFNVGIQEMGDVLNRLRSVTMRTSKLKVFSAPKFSCGNNANTQCKPRDMQHYRQVRNVLFYSLEQRFRFLRWQVQDYRELQGLKLAK